MAVLTPPPPPPRPSLSPELLIRKQLTLRATRRTPNGASRLVHAMLAWSVKTRRAPSRHRRDARVYGLKNTALHETSTSSLSPPTRLHFLFLPMLVFISIFFSFMFFNTSAVFLPYVRNLTCERKRGSHRGSSEATFALDIACWYGCWVS